MNYGVCAYKGLGINLKIRSNKDNSDGQEIFKRYN